MTLNLCCILLWVATLGSAFEDRILTPRDDDTSCWNDQFQFRSEMSTAIDQACSQIGSITITKGDWKGATIHGQRLLGDPSEVPALLFLSFENRFLDDGWFIDQSFCSSTAKDLMNRCSGKHSDSSGGVWHRTEGDITLDPSRDLTPTDPTWSITNGKCFESDCGTSEFQWSFDLVDHSSGTQTHCDHSGSVLNCKLFHSSKGHIAKCA